MVIISSKKNNFFSKKLILTDEIKNIETQFDNNITKTHQSFQYYFELDEDILEYIIFPAQFMLNYFSNPIKIDFYIKSNDKESFCLFENSENKLDYSIKQTIEKQCAKNDLQLIILSEEHIKFKLENSRFLIRYKIPNPNLDYRELNIVLTLLRNNGKMSIKEILYVSSKLEETQGLKLYAIWCGIANCFISYDKNSKLTMDSLIWL